MAIFKQGIHGGFRGRVGNIIGSTWKGKGVMKIRPASVTNPNTERQQNQRARFSLVGRFLQAFRNLVVIGFRAYTKSMTAINAAMSYNLANAVKGEFPDLLIDFSKVQISRGTLSPVTAVSATSSDPASLVVSWANNAQAGNANDTDQLSVSLYDSSSGEVVYFLNCASRADGTVILIVPAEWSGRTVEVLTFFVVLEGTMASTARESVSNTVWAGSVEIG
jgi:hypothetical protein